MTLTGHVRIQRAFRALNVRMMHQNEKTNRTLRRQENRIDRGLLENLTCTKVGDGRKQANKPRKQCKPLAVHKSASRACVRTLANLLVRDAP